MGVEKKEAEEKGGGEPSVRGEGVKMD